MIAQIYTAEEGDYKQEKLTKLHTCCETLVGRHLVENGLLASNT
jgi:hypothetical protein